MKKKLRGAYVACIGSDEVFYVEDYYQYSLDQNGGVPSKLIGPKGEIGFNTPETMERLQKELFFNHHKNSGKTTEELEKMWEQDRIETEIKAEEALQKFIAKGGKVIRNAKN